MALVPAYDTRTGEKLPYFVPQHHIEHPVLGKHLSATKPDTKSAPAAKRAANGDNTKKEK